MSDGADSSKYDSLTPWSSVEELSHIFRVLDCFHYSMHQSYFSTGLQKKLWGVFVFRCEPQHVFTDVLLLWIYLLWNSLDATFTAPCFKLLTFPRVTFSSCELYCKRNVKSHSRGVGAMLCCLTLHRCRTSLTFKENFTKSNILFKKWVKAAALEPVPASTGRGAGGHPGQVPSLSQRDNHSHLWAV